MIARNGHSARPRLPRQRRHVRPERQLRPTPPPAYLDFTKLSGHYVSPLVINDAERTGRAGAASPTRARAPTAVTCRSTPRSNGSASSPQARRGWRRSASRRRTRRSCSRRRGSSGRSAGGDQPTSTAATPTQQRVLQNQMIESLDTEFGAPAGDAGPRAARPRRPAGLRRRGHRHDGGDHRRQRHARQHREAAVRPIRAPRAPPTRRACGCRWSVAGPLVQANPTARSRAW